MPTLRRTPLLLELDLTEPLVEAEPLDPVSRLRARGRRRLRPTLRALHEAGDDRRVAGLVAKVGGSLPWAVMQELRLGVQAFTAGGRPAVAWSESFAEGASDTPAYVLATAFDEIWLQPGGSLGLLGVGVETTFLRGALDRLGVEPQLEQRYEYKNAADRITRREFTPEHRESVARLAVSVYLDAVSVIAQSRRLSPDRVRELVDSGPRTAAEAVDARLVDRLGYRDEVHAALRRRVGEAAELRFADRWHPSRRPGLPARRRGHLALVEVHGAISSGHTRRGVGGRQVGSATVAAELRAAAEDDRAHAVVLRVDSPGGSAVASEVIWREVCRVRDAGKPVVVSMGTAAASGGYYIACPADVIVALPATLTGSIGVFGGKVVVRDLLERGGLTTGSVEEGARSLMFSPRRGFSDDERARLAAALDAVYTDFVAKVAAGRQRSVADVETVARGRVWTGRDAVEVGLVDELGGLHDALRIARSRAGLPQDAPVVRPVNVGALARLQAPRNSEDPRVLAGAGWPGWSDLTEALGHSAGPVLRMPQITLR